VKATKQALGGSAVNAEVTAYWLHERTRFRDPENRVGVGHQDNINETNAMGVDSYLDFGWGDFQQVGLLASAQLESFEDRDDYATASSEEIDGQQRYTYQLGVEDTIYLANYRLQLKPQILLTHLAHDFGGNAAFQSDTIEAPEDGSHTSYKLGLNYQLLDGLHAKANGGYGLRYPNFSELFGDRGGVKGNPELEPEEGWQADLGFALQQHDVPLAGYSIPRLFGELSFFYSDMQNLIVYEQNSQRTVVAKNADSAIIWGVEVSWDIQPIAWLAISGNYTYQHTENTSDRPQYEGKQLPGRPTHQAFHRLEVFNERIRLFGEYHHMSENYLDQYNSEFDKLDRRDLYNAGITVSPRNWIALTFEIKNLTDELVSDVLGYPIPGTTYIASVNLDL
jgi:iron complex outermembrane receptor protein